MRASLLAIGALLAGCNAPEPPQSTGGTGVTSGPCGRGAVVVNSNYQATNVSLVDWQGQVLSSSFVSSAGQAGLSAKLSGDVVVPTESQSGAEILLVDRSATAVLSWVRVDDAVIERQLPVGQGFFANPQDYLELSTDKAYVSRLGYNPDPGKEPFDTGDDVLVIDPQAPAIVGRIDLSPAMAAESAEFRASPGRMVRGTDDVFVLLQSYAANFSSAASRLVRIDPASDSVVETLVLDGFHECEGLSLSPNETEVVVTCSGSFDGDNQPDPDSSGILRVAVSGALTLKDTLTAAELGGAPLGFGVAHAQNDVLLVNTFGAADPVDGSQTRPDTVLEVELAGRTAQQLLASDDEAFTLGDVRCAAKCGVCYATDADRNLLWRFDRDRDGASESVVVDDRIGLPPRYLGGF